ncbi:uncharacterized protein BO95DRAFT_437236, partial [Aspergillus brunneoviolaceus CBS 621.78]
DHNHNHNHTNLTTTVTQPSDRAGRITEIAARSTELRQNIINPVPTLTLSSCYPRQCYSSAIAPHNPATVHPADLSAGLGDVQSHRDVSHLLSERSVASLSGWMLLHSAYGVYLPDYRDATRPGLGAVCTSSVWPNVLMDTTRYDAAGRVTVIPTSAGKEGTLVFATAFDGTSATVVGEASATAGGVSGSLGGGGCG